jgi:hypothetical protein
MDNIPSCVNNIVNPTDITFDSINLSSFVSTANSKIAVEIRYTYYQDIGTVRTTVTGQDVSASFLSLFGIPSSPFPGQLVVSDLFDTSSISTQKEYKQYLFRQ